MCDGLDVNSAMDKMRECVDMPDPSCPSSGRVCALNDGPLKDGTRRAPLLSLRAPGGESLEPCLPFNSSVLVNRLGEWALFYCPVLTPLVVLVGCCFGR